MLPILVPFPAVSAGVTRIPCFWTARCPYTAVLVDATLLTAVVSDAP